MSGRVVVVGSLNEDVRLRVERLPLPGETVMAWQVDQSFGGKGANQAVAARLAGAEVHLVGCVGADTTGTAYRNRLSSLGIDVSRVRVSEHLPTGRALVTVDLEGENSIVVVPGANHDLRTHDVADLPLRPGDVLLAQLEVPGDVVSAAVVRAVDCDAQVVLNLAPFVALPPETVAAADPVVVNQQEALSLADSGLVAGSVLVTFGAGGASWDGEHRDGTAVSAARLRDTVGAGDAFCGALAAALALGEPRDAALDTALAAGADAVRRPGAQPPCGPE